MCGLGGMLGRPDEGVLHRINGVGDVEDISRAILSALGVE